MDTVSYAQVRTMLRFADVHGLSIPALRCAAGLPDAGVEDPDARIPAPAVRALWREIARQAGDPAFALKIASHAEPALFGLVGALLQCSGTLGDALEVLARHQRLLADDGFWEIERGARFLAIAFVTPAAVVAEIGVVPIEFSLGAVLSGARRLTGVPIVPREATFAYARPSYAVEYTKVFGPGVRFEARANQLRFDRAVGQLPVTSSAPQLARLLEASALDRRAKLVPGKEWTRRVAEALEVLCVRGVFGGAAVARHLHCSERSLTRRLHKDGTSLRELTDSMRLANARRLMEHRDTTLEEIAGLLGFSELKAFHRAFVRWTGSPPGEYRRKMLQRSR
jgi:AraC-like DNA-binding protein